MGIRILVVDDSAYDRELTVRALRKVAVPPGPVETVGVGDWRAAEGHLADGGIDVVLLDFHMPAMNALDVLRALQGRPHPPVIMMTGQNDVATAVETLRAGASDYIPKGDDWDVSLCVAVERVLERVRLEQELARSRAQLRTYASGLEAKVESRTAVVRAQAAEIEALYLKVEEAARLKAEIVANVSHELRTPLNAIFGYTELLTEHLQGDPAEMLSCVRVQAERLHQLVESLLALGRLKAGREDIEVSTFSLPELVAELRTQAEVLNADRGLALDWRMPEAPCLVTHDREKLRVIAYHLVNNAIKFTPVGRVEVTFETTSAGGVTLTVSDTGIGFPHEAEKIIFEDFRQLDGSLTRRYEGTGLGLGIVRRCTELLHGTLRSQSAPHYGTTIVVDLPPLAESAVAAATERRPA
jgi:signal transduction histidine kinase